MAYQPPQYGQSPLQQPPAQFQNFQQYPNQPTNGATNGFYNQQQPPNQQQKFQYASQPQYQESTNAPNGVPPPTSPPQQPGFPGNSRPNGLAPTATPTSIAPTSQPFSGFQSAQTMPAVPGSSGIPSGFPARAGTPGAPTGIPAGPGTQGAPTGFPPGSRTQGVPTGFPPGPGGHGAPSGFPPGPGTQGASPSFPPGPGTQGVSNSFQPAGASPSVPGAHTALNNTQPGPGAQNAPTNFPPGPGLQSQPNRFQPGPGSQGAPARFPPGPGAQGVPAGFPPGPGGQGAPAGFPPGPGLQNQPNRFPPGPGSQGAPVGYPPGAPAYSPGNQGPPSSFPPGPPSGFPPGPPTGFPPGPGSMGAPSGYPPGPPGAYPSGPGGPVPNQGGYPGAPVQQRLDPKLMPSAVQMMDEDSTRAGIFPTGFPHADSPPLVSTNIYVQDQGNCNPKFMRSTLYVAPQTNDLLKTSQIPFAVVVSPFSALHEMDIEPPVVDLGPQGPVRCQRCKAYICPFMEFQDGGRRFKCPFCNASTPVEDAYFAHLDHTGRRTDVEMRPELFLGAYDLVATKQYCKNNLPPKEPAFIFMIDVSYNAISNGLVNLLCQNLEKVLASLPRENGQLTSSIRVGLATFDQAVHFFDLSSANPKMIVMTDVQEPFVPLVEGLLLPYDEALPGLKAALAEIPKIFAPSKLTETILQPVVQAGLDSLKCADRAGKLIIFSTVLPTFEAPGKLKTKNERNLLGTDKEKTALVPQDETYTKLGEQCVKAGVTIDLFLFPNAFIDVATIGQMSAVTGGSIFKFQYFSHEKDGVRFLKELEQHVSKKVAFDCMARVRTSSGIRSISFMGSFYMENSTDLELASIDESKSFVAEIKHDDKLSGQSAIIQTAVLYTSVSGQRRLRILNLCLPISGDYDQLFRLADSQAITTYMLKQAIQINREKGTKEVRDQLTAKSAQIFATYREKCNENAPLGQLILPESLKLLPLYVNSILKIDAVSGGSEMTVDDKLWQMELIRGIRVEDAMPLIYPRVIEVSSLDVTDPEELSELPPLVRASIDYFDNKKAYLIDNGVILFLWIGLSVDQQWIQDVFNVAAASLIDAETGIIPERDNGKSRALRRVIQLLPKGIRQRKTYLIIEKSALEPWMKKFLNEDKSSPTSMSYVDFLCHIHREIRNLIS